MRRIARGARVIQGSQRFLTIPWTGRGTIRRMVEGYCGSASGYPSTMQLRYMVPLPKQAWGGEV
jgi:hypothetical protein